MPHFPKPFFRKSRQLWYVQLDGQQINLGPVRAEAFRQYHALMASPRHTRLPLSVSVAVVELADLFLDWVRANRSAATFEWYRLRLQQFATKYPRLTVTELRPYHVDQWAREAGGSQTTCRNRIRSVKRCLSWAKRQGHIDVDPIDMLEVPSGQQKEVYVSPEEFERLLELVPDEQFADLLMVTYATGCRPQESLRVEARHVDFKNSRWIFPASESKGRAMPRIVYLNDEALAISRRMATINPDGPLFRNRNGRPWTKDSIGCAFDRLCIRMGSKLLIQRKEEPAEREINSFAQSLCKTRTVKGKSVFKSQADLRTEAKRKLTQRRARQLAPRYSLYALRHSWATNALQRGIDSLTVAVLMGHRDPSTLARVYQHLSHSPQHLLDQAKRATA